MTASHAHASAPTVESFDSKIQQSPDQAPMQLAASDAYKPGSQTLFRNECHSGQNENMGDDKLQDFLDNNLAPHDLFKSCTGQDKHKNVIEPPDAQCHPGSGHSDSGSDNTAPRDRNSGNHSDNTLPRDRTDRGDDNGYSRDDCHSPRDTHQPGDTTDVPGTRTPSNPGDRVTIEPCKDMPKPPLNPGEFLVVVINVSADQLDRAGDFIGRLLNSAFNRDNSNGSSGSTGGDGNGFHMGGIPSPGDVLGSLPGLGNLFGGHDGGRDGSGIPGPGDLLGGLPGVGELFGGGDDSQSGSGLPSPGDVLGNLPGLGNLFGGGNHGRGGSGIPTPGDILGSIPGPGDILSGLPGMGGNSGIPTPGDLLHNMPGPGDILGSLPGMSGGGSGDSGSGSLFGNLPGLGSFGGSEGGGIMNPGSFFNNMPGPSDLFSNLPNPGDVLPPLPGLGGDSKIPMPHEIIEDAVTKPLKSIKNLFKKIF